MTKILSIDEMLSAAIDSGMPDAGDFSVAIETIATALAHSLASHLKIETNFANFQRGFGGTCAPFFPAHEGQECPEVIDENDQGGDWEPHSEFTPATPDNVAKTLAAALSQIIARM